MTAVRPVHAEQRHFLRIRERYSFCTSAARLPAGTIEQLSYRTMFVRVLVCTYSSVSVLQYADSVYLLLALRSLIPIRASMLCPPRLGGLSERLAADLRTDVPPARCTKADSLPFNRRWREFPAGDVEHLQREIDQDLRRKSTLPHDALQRHASPYAQTAREIVGDLSVTYRTRFGC